MKTIIIYYSLDGNCQLMAKNMASEINADLLRLQPVKELSGGKFKKIFWGGKQVLFKDKPQLTEFNLDLSQYDNVILGSPVWVGTFVPAFNTFFEKITIENKQVGLFCCFGGNEAKIFQNFKQYLNNCEIKGEIGFKDPKIYDTEQNIQKAKNWINNLF